MDRNYNGVYSKFDLRLLLILSLYFVIGLILLNYYQYLLYSDGISYISIAQKYMMGDFNNAINGYWGPLFSWLIIPFLYFGNNPLQNMYLTRILSLFIGCLTIIGVKLLSDKLEINGWIQFILLLSLIPILLTMFIFITPDLLIVCFLIFYLCFLFDCNYLCSLKNGIFCGLLGGMAFLTKSYAFVFFILHYTISNLIFYYQNISIENKKVISKNFLLGLMVFFVISGAWIGLISDKYGYLTIGSAGKYNYELVGPQSQGHAMYYQGLIKPPNKSAVSAWEDPTYFDMESWSAYSSWNNFEYQLKLIWTNILKIIDILENFSVLSIFIIIAAVLFMLKTSSNTIRRRILGLLVTILISASIYCIILVEVRYLWLVYILLFILGIYIIHNLKINGSNKFITNFLIILLVISFIIGPIKGLALYLNYEQDIYYISQTLKSDYDVKGNIASNNYWELNDHLAYFLNSKYYGITTNKTDLNSQLRAYNIDYYLVWDNTNELNISGYQEIKNVKISRLRIFYKIN